MDASELTEALGGKWRNTYGSASCPAHDDNDPSLSITERDGKLLVKCHTGCAQADVIERLRELHLWPEATAPSIGRIRMRANGSTAPKPEPAAEPAKVEPTRIVARYDYRDEQGALLYQSVRLEPKSFRQRRQDAAGGWIWNLDGVRLVPYRLPELLAAEPRQPVFVVEGEKDVERLAAIGVVATTNAMGAGKWRAEYAEWLRDRHVVVVPDNDDTGRQHAAQVAESVRGLAASVRVLALPGLPDRGDASDWLDAGGDIVSLLELATAAEPLAVPEVAYPIRTLADLMEQQHESGAQLIEGLVWRGWIHWLFAQANSGKTVWALAKGLHIAAGRDFLGRRVEQGPVLLISEDSPDSIIQEYIETLCELFSIEWRGLPFYVNREHGLRIDSDEGIVAAREAFESCPEEPVYEIIDSCESIVPSDKYTPKEFDPFGRYLRWVSDRRCAVEVIDHARKEVKDNKSTPLLEKLYGSIVKGKIADCAMYLNGSFKDGKLIGEWAKFRGNFPPPIEITFHSDTGFELRDLLGSNLSPTEQKITKWLASAPGAWYTKAQVCEGTGISQSAAERALPRLVEIRWIVRRGERGSEYEYSRNPDAGKVFR